MQPTVNVLKLQMESLEVRRLRLDLLHAYKLLFGLVHVSTDDLFIPSDNNSRRGHNFKLYMPISRTSVRINSYSTRVMRVWNSVCLEIKSILYIHLYSP